MYMNAYMYGGKYFSQAPGMKFWLKHKKAICVISIRYHFPVTVDDLD